MKLPPLHPDDFTLLSLSLSHTHIIPSSLPMTIIIHASSSIFTKEKENPYHSHQITTWKMEPKKGRKTRKTSNHIYIYTYSYILHTRKKRWVCARGTPTRGHEPLVFRVWALFIPKIKRQIGLKKSKTKAGNWIHLSFLLPSTNFSSHALPFLISLYPSHKTTDKVRGR